MSATESVAGGGKALSGAIQSSWTRLWGTWPAAAPPALIVLILLAVYAATAPRTVALEDDGIFILATLDAGVAHPPGYPLFVLLGRLLSYLPLGSPAFRLHLVSGLFGALACAMLYLIGRRISVPAWAAAIAALGWGLSEHFWSQAIITEVYTLNSLLCLAVFYCLLCAQNNGAPRIVPLRWAALCFGLGLANHWPLIVLAGPAFLILLVPLGRQVIARLPGLVLVALSSAGILYGWMVWRSHHQGVVNFYGPIDSLESFWFIISRKGYAGIDTSPTATILDDLAFVWFFAKNLATQITLPGGLLALLGTVCAWRAGHRWVVLAALAVVVMHGFALAVLLNFDFDYFKMAVFRPYPITAYGFWALWVGYGLGAGLAWLHATPGGRIGARFAAPCALAIPLYLLSNNLHVNDRSEYRFAADYARKILTTLPDNAVYLAHGDVEVGPMGYFHHIEGLRPDIELISLQGLVFPNRLFSPLLKKKARKELLWKYIEKSPRPLFLTTHSPLDPGREGYAFTGNGLYMRIDRLAKDDVQRAWVERDIITYLQDLEPYARATDIWTYLTYSKMMHRAGRWLARMEMAGAPDAERTLTQPVRELVTDNYGGITGLIEMFLEHGEDNHLEQVQQLLTSSEALIDENSSKERVGRFHYLKGYLAYKRGAMREALEHFRISRKIHPHKDNPSLEAVDTLCPPDRVYSYCKEKPATEDAGEDTG